MNLPDSKAVENFKKNYLAYSILALASVVVYLFIEIKSLHQRIELIIETNGKVLYENQNVLLKAINENTKVLEKVNQKIEK